MKYVRNSGALVQIFLSEDDRYNGLRLYDAILNLAHDLHLTGTTVLRGVEGFGASSNIHSEQNLRMAEDLPIVVEVVETRERLEPFIEQVEVILNEANARGCISVVPSEVIHPSTS